MGRCILVVDDDHDLLELLELVLQLEGYEVVTLQESQHACYRAAQIQPALVIQDLRMEQPDTGWRILRQLRATPATQHIPVLIASAEPSLEDQAARLDVDHVATVGKPFLMEELLQKMRLLLQL